MTTELGADLIANTTRKKVSLCVQLSLEYDEPAHPLFVEAQACYPLMKNEKALKKELEDLLLDKIMDMFGLQSLTLISNTGLFYLDYESREWVITWNHGTGDKLEAVGVVWIE